MHKVVKENPECKIKRLYMTLNVNKVMLPKSKSDLLRFGLKEKKLHAHVVYKRTINTKCCVKS